MDGIHDYVCLLKNDLIHSIDSIVFSSLSHNSLNEKDDELFFLLISIRDCFLEKGVDNS